MRISNLLSAVAASATLLATPAAVSADTVPGNEWRQVAYSCESGQELTIAFKESGSSVRVTESENPAVKLNARPAKTGFRFSDSRYELRGEVNAVTWKIGSRAAVKCTTQDSAAADLAAFATR